MSVVSAVAQLLAAGGDYQISRSVRLRSSASAYFNRTPAGAGNRRTFSIAWSQKRTLTGGSVVFCAGDAGSPTNTFIVDYSSDSLRILSYVAGSLAQSWTTTQVFRDPSAWYHFLLAVDTTQATANNRVRLYVNGLEVTAFTRTATFAQNTDTSWNAALAHYIGRLDYSAVGYPDTYLTEIVSVSGLQLTPSSFGAFDPITGVWTPAKYGGPYGTDGFYLNFSDNSAATAAAIGKDYSGNGNNWTPNNISVSAGATYDSMIDVPTPYADGGNGRGNYCVLSPLDWNTTAFTLSNGNLTWTSTTTANGSTRGTVGMTTGKWYWEVTATSVGSGTAGVGIAKDGSTQFGSGQALYGSNLGNKYIDGVNTAYGATWATGNVIGVAYDADAGQITFYKDNASQGAISLTGYAGVNVCPAVADGSSLAFTLDANFGQRPFAYTPPTGFKALNTQNLPDATIKKGNQYFDVNTWTGTGATQSITNGGFQPDLVWVKSRSAIASHNIVDAVRGLGNTMYSDSTAAEVSIANQVTALNSNGFTLGADTNGGTNFSGRTFVGWQWKKGAAQGFDIVTYTGTGANRTVAHSLGVAPSMMIVKTRSGVDSWVVYNSNFSAPSTDYLLLNSTAAKGTTAGFWNGGANSSTFGLGAFSSINANAATYVAYLFAEVAGFSKFGSYTGNGSADGSFVYLGFKPRLVMVKRTDSAGNWYIYDTARETYNVMTQSIYPNLSNAESNDGATLDILSNGFKWRRAGVDQNASGGTYIYAAFAENPFKNSLAR